MKRPDINHIHAVMKQQGMKVFQTPFSMTLGAIRTKDNKSGRFNDWIFASLFTEDGGILSTVFPGTTDAGLYYRHNPINPEGTAIIQHSRQYRGVYQHQTPHLNDEHRGHKGQEAFKQIGDMDYWRDPDRDSYLEFEGETYTGNNATNGHDMGTKGENVHTWSAGCWGSVKQNMDILYEMAALQEANGLGDVLSFALLHESDF